MCLHQAIGSSILGPQACPQFTTICPFSNTWAETLERVFESYCIIHLPTSWLSHVNPPPNFWCLASNPLVSGRQRPVVPGICHESDGGFAALKSASYRYLHMQHGLYGLIMLYIIIQYYICKLQGFPFWDGLPSHILHFLTLAHMGHTLQIAIYWEQNGQVKSLNPGA
jgi:hypothetical protein